MIRATNRSFAQDHLTESSLTLVLCICMRLTKEKSTAIPRKVHIDQMGMNNGIDPTTTSL